MLAQQPQVQRRAVTLVLIEGILRILLVQAQQVRVAGGLGQDGRGRDRRHQGVSLITVCTVQPSGRLVAVHQRQLRRDGQALHRALHRQHGGAQDVQAVDLWTLALAMNQASARSRISSASASRRAGERLGIGQALDRPGRIENHGGGIDRSGQWAPAGLVHAGGDLLGLGRGPEKIRLHRRRPRGWRARPARACRAAGPGAAP